MRRLIFTTTLVMGVIASGTALANYMYPGRIIIGYGGGGGGGGGTTTGGTTTNAAAEEFGCVLEKELDCECFPGLNVLQACEKSGVKTGCLTPDMKYLEVSQKEPVLIETGEQVLGALVCTKESKLTAYVSLPLPGK